MLRLKPTRTLSDTDLVIRCFFAATLTAILFAALGIGFTLSAMPETTRIGGSLWAFLLGLGSLSLVAYVYFGWFLAGEVLSRLVQLRARVIEQDNLLDAEIVLGSWGGEIIIESSPSVNGLHLPPNF